MANPWGLSGPEFLWLYIGGFVVAGIATLLLRRRIRSSSDRRPQEPLTVDETALLTGGWIRVVESALANLVARNVVRVQRGGALSVVHDATAKPESAIEERLFNRIKKRTARPLPYHLASLANQPEYDRISRSLADKGLYYYGGSRRESFVAALPLFVLLAIGIARWINGVNLGFPVGYLTLLLILTVVTALFALRLIKAGPTKAGRRALAQRAKVTEDAAASVARLGMEGYPDLTISKLFRETRTTTRRTRVAYSSSGASTGVWFGGAGASSCGGAGSSSGGGSSCGGGGGGGCGGGGS